MDITAETRLVTLIGRPVAHSRSPRIHNTAFQTQNVDAVYVATSVRDDAVGAAVEGLRALSFLGANVTAPHKQAVVPHLDTVTDRAEAVGAVNTIVCDETSGDEPPTLRGDNTDVAGFLDPLDGRFASDLRGAPMLVFGAGGAARAVVYALMDRYAPETLTLVARRPEQAEALADDLSPHDATDALQVTPFDDARPHVRSSRLLVNATPLGMHPETEGTPWPEAEDLSPAHVVYDLVYNPEETRLLRDAAEQGATTIGGLTMLVGQAAAAFTQWTDRPFPRDAVLDALRD